MAAPVRVYTNDDQTTTSGVVLQATVIEMESLAWALQEGWAGWPASPKPVSAPLPRSQAGITSGCLNFLKLKFWGSYSSPQAEKRVFHLLSQLHSLIVLHLSVLSMFIQVKVFAAAFHSHKHAGQGCAWSN